MEQLEELRQKIEELREELNKDIFQKDLSEYYEKSVALDELIADYMEAL